MKYLKKVSKYITIFVELGGIVTGYLKPAIIRKFYVPNRITPSNILESIDASLETRYTVSLKLCVN